ncbi:type IV pilus assembly protein FimV [Kushneria sp. TE3]|uniref:type IV pilus assembly protein FimV n=1 Tax=Kushneria sp. TE3 TaxID=3449832 RepID=UPI003F687A2A
MAERPWHLRIRSVVMATLLMSASMTSQAVGLATPQVMSGFNEPLRARVALLDTGALRADDVRVALADSERWQAMDVVRSADTDTLRLAVNGRPGHLYLEVQGSRPLATPWLDVVLTLNWPQGELTPQLTLLPSTGGVTDHQASTAAGATSDRPAAGERFAATSETSRNQGGERQTREAPAQDTRRLAALEERIDRLEQQLSASREAQTNLMSALESVRAQSLAGQDSFDTAGMTALVSRQQALESRLDQLDQNGLTAAATADPVVQEAAPLQDTSPQEASVAPVPESTIDGRDSGFVWTWALASLLLLLAGGWALLCRWQQKRYRLVSATELSPMSNPSRTDGEAASSLEASGEDQGDNVIHAEQDAAWSAHRAQVEAICSEAEVFRRHGRRDHAVTMLEKGLEQYPNDFQLIRALAALEATAPNDEPGDDKKDEQRHQTASDPISDETPAFAPSWSLESFAQHDEVESGQGSAFGVTDRRTEPVTAPTADFPHDWALEEVAFEGGDADNERPDADRLRRHA